VKLLEKAERWQAILDEGEVTNRAALARQAGTSTNRVTQVLRLLELPSDLLSTMRLLPPGTPPRLVTERWLRRLRTAAALEEAKQRCLAWLARRGRRE
jgi:hypothetical protein